MTHLPPSLDPPPEEANARTNCHVCGREAAGPVAFLDLHKSLQDVVQANVPSSDTVAQICPRCVDVFSRAKRNSNLTQTFLLRRTMCYPRPYDWMLMRA